MAARKCQTTTNVRYLAARRKHFTVSRRPGSCIRRAVRPAARRSVRNLAAEARMSVSMATDAPRADSSISSRRRRHRAGRNELPDNILDRFIHAAPRVTSVSSARTHTHRDAAALACESRETTRSGMYTRGKLTRTSRNVTCSMRTEAPQTRNITSKMAWALAVSANPPLHLANKFLSFSLHPTPKHRSPVSAESAELEALGQCTPPPRHVLPVSRYQSRCLSCAGDVMTSQLLWRCLLVHAVHCSVARRSRLIPLFVSPDSNESGNNPCIQTVICIAPKFNRLFTGPLLTFLENFVQIRLEVFAQSY